MSTHTFPDDIRAMLEARETQFLDERAQLSSRSRGRMREEERDPYRTEFQRDRDRIIHTKAFRRLKHKTQVFVSPEFDHYRTRLTHTLEVTQIARTVSRALRLNEDLTEAIGLGHDLGHAPFGHVGEEALDRAYRRFDAKARFRHYEHSLRVVDELEKAGRGLNLTWEVRDGILRHSKGKSDLMAGRDLPATLEGQVVRLCDRVAYVNHDIDDAIRAGLIGRDDLPRDILRVLGAHHSQRITTMVDAILSASSETASSASSEMINGERRVLSAIAMEDEVRDATDQLKNWMFEHIYKRDTVDESARVENVVGSLFAHFMEKPHAMKDAHGDALLAAQQIETFSREELARRVCDYIAGMTDRFASHTYAELFMPSSWRGV